VLKFQHMAKNQQAGQGTPELSRREREVMDIVYRLGEATVGEVLEAMEDPPTYSAVRSTVRILEGKGHLTHRSEGNRYVYLPTVDAAAARLSALDHLLETFFAGSAADAVTALLEERGGKLSERELKQLSKLIREARRDGR
jgi:predicted transcriptional regulator